ncbi:hypothetical protein [Cytobacillus gottheilii]|uniref:hypothetical protein n=1 Tax=Cytobacillus gottheilii TaxID=859144 RepID=UPI000830BA77|nr:hypothetical protein [Cytobacillus gottheilii]
MLDLSNVKLPFDVNELVHSGMMFLGFISPFVLLALAFYFVPKIISIIHVSFGVYQDNKINSSDPQYKEKYRQSYRESIKENWK